MLRFSGAADTSNSHRDNHRELLPFHDPRVIDNRDAVFHFGEWKPRAKRIHPFCIVVVVLEKGKRILSPLVTLKVARSNPGFYRESWRNLELLRQTNFASLTESQNLRAYRSIKPLDWYNLDYRLSIERHAARNAFKEATAPGISSHDQTRVRAYPLIRDSTLSLSLSLWIIQRLLETRASARDLYPCVRGKEAGREGRGKRIPGKVASSWFPCATFRPPSSPSSIRRAEALVVLVAGSRWRWCIALWRCVRVCVAVTISVTVAFPAAVERTGL